MPEILNINEAKDMAVDELYRKLLSCKEGLSIDEAQKRILEFGPNEIIEKKTNPLLKFLKYFWGPIPWMIEIASILSAVIKHWEDFWIIIILLMINACVGFWEEFQAGNAIELLKKKLEIMTRVLRDGKWALLPAKVLVPGDIVRLRPGDSIPADLKLVDGDYLMTDESALTGESLPVEKHIRDTCFAGSLIQQGEMIGLVVSTGMNTYFGKTASLVGEAHTQSHFQKAVIKIGNYLIVMAAALVVVIIIVSLFRHESILETLQFALVLAVASVPVALPAVLTVTMAVGVVALAKKEAIVSKLVSIEEMAGMDVLCSDKTGTITKNQISLAEIKPFEGFDEKDVLVYGTLASKAENQDPIDLAIITKSGEKHYDSEINEFKLIQFKPFDPINKRAESECEDRRGNHFKSAKGAPQIILSLIENKERFQTAFNETINIYASRGLRTLAVGKTDTDGKWKLVGLIALQDPPRDDSAETIQTAKDMGIQVKMVTGDHTAIAKEIAKLVHLGTNILPAESIINQSDNISRSLTENADGFAQVFPEHKYHIVELLQQNGHIVGMTGDGVNDAPALKKADAGIAVSGSTDAAKSAAAIVLTKPGLSVIIDAIKQSRIIFQRMNNYAIYRIAETIRVIFFITLSILAFNFYPITALMIVLLAVLNDAPIMSIAFDNVKYSRTPDRWNMRNVLGIATYLGLIGVVFSFLILFIGKELFHFNDAVLQSFIYLKLSIGGHLTVFVARTKGHFWSIKPAWPLFLSVIITQLIATLITVYGFLLPAMGWLPALFVWGYALAAFLITDFLKVGIYNILDHVGIRFKR